MYILEANNDSRLAFKHLNFESQVTKKSETTHVRDLQLFKVVIGNPNGQNNIAHF